VIGMARVSLVFLFVLWVIIYGCLVSVDVFILWLVGWVVSLVVDMVVCTF